jgi:hypothetical protein
MAPHHGCLINIFQSSAAAATCSAGAADFHPASAATVANFWFCCGVLGRRSEPNVYFPVPSAARRVAYGFIGVRQRIVLSPAVEACCGPTMASCRCCCSCKMRPQFARRHNSSVCVLSIMCSVEQLHAEGHLAAGTEFLRPRPGRQLSGHPCHPFRVGIRRLFADLPGALVSEPSHNVRPFPIRHQKTLAIQSFRMVD